MGCNCRRNLALAKTEIVKIGVGGRISGFVRQSFFVALVSIGALLMAPLIVLSLIYTSLFKGEMMVLLPDRLFRKMKEEWKTTEITE